MPSMTWNDPLLTRFGFTDQTKTEAIITAVDAALDRYCGRNLAEATHDRVCTVLGTGDVHLKAYPVSKVLRVLNERVEVLTITATGTIGIANTMTGAITLQNLSGGTLVSTVLAYADYPTLSELATAIGNVSGFDASVASDYTDYPSTDLVAGQHWQGGTNGTQHMLFSIWCGDGGSYDCDHATGILHLGFRSYPQCRVQWIGGYASYPDDLKMVVAEMVGSVAKGQYGTITGESFGGEYSYTIGSIDVRALPVTMRSVIDSYKDRSL